jgi:lipopolysaccharide biosynthesis glycosyltransferase
MITPEAIILVCAADDAYAMPLAVTLRSASENLRATHRLEVFVLDGGVSDVHRALLESSLDAARVCVHWVVPSAETTRRLAPDGRLSIVTYFRLFVTDLLPRDAHKAIFLDCDVVVLGDLARLWETAASKHPVHAVRDAIVGSVGSELGLANHRELGLAPDLPYFNAGVLLLDLDAWRALRLGERVLCYLDEHRDRIRFHDQEAMNAVLRGGWEALDPRWNQMPGNEVEDPWIVHYATWDKPWHFRCTHPQRELFFRYLDETRWAGWRPRKTPADTSLGRLWLRLWRGLRRRALSR